MVEESAGWSENEIVTIPLYNGKQYRGYKWNRSHLIADSLGGRAKRENLITGTRTQNVGANDGKGGMAYTERKAVAWLNKYHNGSVYYSANPVYKGKELIPRSVIVDIKTSDKSINERVVVYNAAKGLKINYTSGATKTIKTTKKVTKKNTTRKSKTKKKESSGGSSKTVYTTQTGSKYHMSKNCRGLSRAKKIYSTALSDAKESGFEPCNICCN